MNYYRMLAIRFALVAHRITDMALRNATTVERLRIFSKLIANYRVSAPFITLYAQIGMYCSLKQNNMKKTLKILELIGIIALIVLTVMCYIKLYKLVVFCAMIC